MQNLSNLLTGAERKYISAVIEPFRFNTIAIRKAQLKDGRKRIEIAVKKPGTKEYDAVILAPFETGFDGLEINHFYKGDDLLL